MAARFPEAQLLPQPPGGPAVTVLGGAERLPFIVIVRVPPGVRARPRACQDASDALQPRRDRSDVAGQAAVGPVAFRRGAPITRAAGATIRSEPDNTQTAAWISR